MPTYDFQCTCGVLFEASAKMQARNEPRPCPKCGHDALIVLPSTVQGHFTTDVTGPKPQNTGISGIDAHIDRVIGQSAAQGWAVTEERVRRKREILRDNPGVDGHSLSKAPDGDYRVLAPEERAAHERSQAIHGAAMTTLRPSKKLPPR